MSTLVAFLSIVLLPQLWGRLLLPNVLPHWGLFTRLTRVIVCQATGYLLQGLLFLTYRLLFDSRPVPTLLMAGLLWVVCLRLSRGVAPEPVPQAENSRKPLKGVLLVGLVLQSVGSAAVVTFHWLTHPLGNMDAYSHWMLRAGFFSDSELWRRCFAPNLNSPEYPLLFPSTIAMASSCRVDMLIPVTIWLEMVFAAATALILYEGIALLRGKRVAALGAVVYLSAPWVLYRASCLYADTVMCFLVSLTTLVLVSSRKEKSEALGTPVLVGLGLIVGLAWLTKHEGVVFFGNVLLTLLLWQVPRKGFSGLAAFAGPVFLLATLHMLSRAHCVAALSLQSPLNSGSLSLLGKLLDPSRYLLILKAVFRFFVDFYWWNAATPSLILAVGMLVGLKAVPKKVLVAFAPVLLQFTLMAAYFVVSPVGLESHLQTAFPRLILHTYPAILMLMMACWNLEDEKR